MKELALITGGGNGIGAALALKLADEGINVLIAGRNKDSLKVVSQKHPSFISFLCCDIATEKGRAEILENTQNKKIKFLVHNAGVLKPVGNLLLTEDKDFEYNFQVNFLAPFFITKALVSFMPKGGRILHVSSGAAHKYKDGLGAYSISKKTFYELYINLQKELVERGINIGSAMPGKVDTGMQAFIRTLNDTVYPGASAARQLYADRKLVLPEIVADFFKWLLISATPQIFCKKDWRIDKWLENGGFLNEED